MPVVMQRQVPVIAMVFATAEVLQVKFIDRVVDVPVSAQRKFQKTEEMPQVQNVEKYVLVPKVQMATSPRTPNHDARSGGARCQTIR